MTAQKESKTPLTIEYDYSDVERYTYCHYKGAPGWIIDKGDHLSDAAGEHILIDLDNGKAPEHMPKTITLHERLVTKNLNDGSFWVDFNNDFMGDY